MSVSASAGNAVLVQADGKILVSGAFNALNLQFVPSVVRFNSDGSLDSGFTAALSRSSSTALESEPKLLALQPNGQMLVAGKLNHPDGSVRDLVRLNGDGSLDASFNPRFSYSTPSATSVFRAIVLGDGRILIGGRFDTVNGINRPALARLNSDGSVDATFNPQRVNSGFGVQSTGKIIVTRAGGFDRLNPDGILDPTFNGTVTEPTDSYSLGAPRIQPDDKIIFTAFLGGIDIRRISRLNADGSNDTTFRPFEGYLVSEVFLQNDGKLIVGTGSSSGPRRLNPDGTYDDSFHPDTLGSMAQQADGRLLAVGQIYSQPYGVRRMFLDGSRDDSFAVGMGLMLIGQQGVDRMALLPNGKVVIVGGFNYVNRTARKEIAFLQSDGALDSSFDAGDPFGPYRKIEVSEVQNDGKVLLGAYDTLLRYNGDGSIDATFNYVPVKNLIIAGVQLQPMGKILLQRTNQAIGGTELLRLNADGLVDPTFHADQPAILQLVQPDGKILIVSGSQLRRLEVDGSLDPGFNANGVSGFIPPQVLAIQPDGKLLVNRFVSSINGAAFTRLNTDGSIDQSFTSSVSTVGVAAAGQFGIYVYANVAPNSAPSHLAVVRLLLDGSRDPNFIVEFNPGARVTRLIVQPDGQLLIAGLFDHVNGITRNSIARVYCNAPRKLANISTRANVGLDDAATIAGFIITGSGKKKVMIRAIGPSLVASGLDQTSVLRDPWLELRDHKGTLLARNDNWRDTQESEIAASGIAPSEDAEAAIMATLQPGSYTGIMRDRRGDSGIAVIEVYDLDPAAEPSMANISTRGVVGANDSALIAGFIVRGADSSRTVVRALGPSLAFAGVQNPVANPTVTLHDQSGAVIASNDDWRETQQSDLEAAGLAPRDEKEAALITALLPGAYTAIVGDANGEEGRIALIEVYQLKE